MPDPINVPVAFATGQLAAEYVLHDMALCPVAAGSKGPRSRGWNERANAITDPDTAAKLKEGVGLLHAYSGTMALDIDNDAEAAAWLLARGINLGQLFAAPGAVAINSGRSGKGKLLYRLPPGSAPVETVKINGPNGMVLEFRCATRDGKSDQDVLPPSIHPRTGQPYQWDGAGDWRNIPLIPDALLGCWQGELAIRRTPANDTGLVSVMTDFPPSDAEQVADRCAIIGAMRDSKGQNQGEEEWRACLGVLRHTVQGEALCHEWSKGHPDYSRAETQAKLDRLRAYGPTLCKTLGTCKPQVCAACPFRGFTKSPITLGTLRFNTGDAGSESAGGGWPVPSPIGRAPLPVLPWEARFLPAVLADMVVSYADSIPMSREFVASNVLAACGSLLSGKVQLALKQHGPWFETPNSWALNIAPVSSHKTPGLAPAREALNRVEERYRQEHQVGLAGYQANKIVYDVQVKAAKAAAVKGKPPAQVPPEPVAPPLRRAVTNNATPEALSALTEGGPVVVLDDEASGLFAQMADPKNQPGKAFYLAAHTGSGSFQTDRIGRGAVYIPRLCVSVIGNIQPEPLLRILLGAAREGRQADGFVQRFGLMTMPDPVAHTHLVDMLYDIGKWAAGQDAIAGLVDYDPVAHGAVASMLGTTLPHFRLSDAAMALWQGEYAKQLAEARNTELMEAYRQHVMKQPKVIATVALVIHAVEGCQGDVSGPVMERAIAASRFYLSHAKRVYHMSAHDVYAEPARQIAARMSRGEVTGEFTSREAQRRGWAGCDTPESVANVLAVLEDADWVRPVVVQPSAAGGRPSKRWQVSPLAQGSKW
ncbi:MAG: DUF3987 domain-containing protein [Novosphingobium meiothermophilum]|uniref:DUF3987 domain-containing protein n=1 Tax=Novosphingobium TaxID=165696 RepID=UPI000D6E4841|nr:MULTISPECIES: DUF3987 domain-containing protein [Novosphingobium]